MQPDRRMNPRPRLWKPPWSPHCELGDTTILCGHGTHPAHPSARDTESGKISLSRRGDRRCAGSARATRDAARHQAIGDDGCADIEDWNRRMVCEGQWSAGTYGRVHPQCISIALEGSRGSRLKWGAGCCRWCGRRWIASGAQVWAAIVPARRTTPPFSELGHSRRASAGRH